MHMTHGNEDIIDSPAFHEFVNGSLSISKRVASRPLVSGGITGILGLLSIQSLQGLAEYLMRVSGVRREPCTRTAS